MKKLLALGMALAFGIGTSFAGDCGGGCGKKDGEKKDTLACGEKKDGEKKDTLACGEKKDGEKKDTLC